MTAKDLSTPWLAALLGLTIGLPMTTARADGPTPIPIRSVRGLDGKSIGLEAPEGGATALVLYSSECPISNGYSPTLNELVDAFPASRLTLVGLCVDPDLGDEQLVEHAREYGLKFPVARDRDGSIAARLGAKVTPEAFVIDHTGAIRYHGRIDDQYADRGQRNAHPEHADLRGAIEAVLAGRPVAAPYVEAVGCPLPEPVAAARTEATYTRDVAAILQRNCQVCHRPGQVGPFPLMTYEQARKRADDVAAVVEDRRMPPWKPVPGVGPAFKHDKSLSADAIDTLVAWAEAGAPEGDPADLPPPRDFPEGWTLGTPDLVLEPAGEFAIPASGDDIYRCFVIPTDLPADVDLSAIEYRPGNSRVVHHLLAYIDTSGQARRRDSADEGPGYSCFSGPGIEVHGDLGGWAPGNEPNFLPEGVGRKLPRKADVVVQVHYHPSGKPETDRTRLGLYFSKSPIKQVLHWSWAANPRMKLPAGASNTEIQAKWTAPVDLIGYAVTPHMHLLGRDMSMAIIAPDGRRQELVRIDDWDFNWQNTYYFREPVEIPKGSTLEVVAHYDNSAGNPRNPNDPPEDVKWGEATTDEMSIGFLGVTMKGQDLTRPGARDELADIFRKQMEDERKKYEERGRRRDQGKPDASN